MRNLVVHRYATLAVIFAFLVAGCQALEGMLEGTPKPTARIIGAELKNLSLDKIDLVFTIELANPYAVDLPLLDLAYKVGSGGTSLLQGNIKPSGTVPAGGTSAIQLPTRITFDALIRTLKGVRPGSVVAYRADLTLSADAPVVGLITLPLTKSGEIPVPAAPEVELASFDIIRLGMDETRATARLNVKNTNPFVLDLSRISIELALGANKVANTSLAKPARIAPGQSVGVDVPLAFSPRSFGLALINLLRGKNAAYSMVGALEAGTPYGNLLAPFNRNGNTIITN